MFPRPRGCHPTGIPARPLPEPTTEFPTPYHIGGRYYVEDIAVGRYPDGETVRDCAGCQGYVYDGPWHVVTRVAPTGHVAEPAESYRPSR
ncbi:hypothetical protein NDI85_06700 [Halomicroarcula sp. S1AR25-4]|uniref:hypothetical protein n=1 Tax=Haloarcula sp. S1AR25-4 TaxID=2950538 RepID=UPI00287618B0|nr:hypothetical protein [Halomicroarcula sp. S1AR25-4]MDS0277477.1 hypothetical protein [Halomicroarcula sp. S1AR25-4]